MAFNMENQINPLTGEPYQKIEQEKPPEKITGYRDLTQEEITAINDIKQTANEVENFIDNLYGNIDGIDSRWVAIAQTDLQKGFMALTRAVAKPSGF